MSTTLDLDENYRSLSLINQFCIYKHGKIENDSWMFQISETKYFVFFVTFFIMEMIMFAYFLRLGI